VKGTRGLSLLIAVAAFGAVAAAIFLWGAVVVGEADECERELSLSCGSQVLRGAVMMGVGIVVAMVAFWYWDAYRRHNRR